MIFWNTTIKSHAWKMLRKNWCKNKSM